MNFLQSAIAKFRTAAFGDLSPDEARQVKIAHDLLLNGWLGGTDYQHKDYPDALKRRRAAREKVIRELASGDPKRQRAALQTKGLEGTLAAERTRNEKLARMLYFKGMNAELNLRTAQQVWESDEKKYDKHLVQVVEGEDARKAAFPGIDNATVRYEAALVCRYVISRVKSLSIRHDPDKIDDEGIRASMLEILQKSMSTYPEDSFLYRLGDLTRLASSPLPDRLLGYAKMIAEPEFVEQLKASWREAQGENLRWILRVEEKILIAPSGR